MPKDIASVPASPMAVWDPVLYQGLPGKWSMWEERDGNKERQSRTMRREKEGKGRES